MYKSVAVATQFAIVHDDRPRYIYGERNTYGNISPSEAYTVELRLENLTRAEVQRLYEVLIKGQGVWEGTTPTPQVREIEAEFVEAEVRPLLPPGRM